MRTRVLRALTLVVAVPLTIFLISGQERPPAVPAPTPEPKPGEASKRSPKPAVPAPAPAPAAPPAPATKAPATKAPAAPAPAARTEPVRDLKRLTPLQKQMFLSAQRGADWMFRQNGVKGRFRDGFLPSLKTELESDHFLRQAGSAYALARAARFTGETRYAVRATQAILTLLAETGLDPKDDTVRYTTLPPALVNRLGAASLLVLAINELPEPQDDLLDASEQLCNYIRRCARDDGSLVAVETSDPKADDEANLVYPGQALYALVRSQTRKQAGWKTELVSKAAAHYRERWKTHQSLAFASWQSAACAEAYLRTRDRALADFVLEMNDWVCGLQYAQINPRNMMWYGGFMSYADGRGVESAPDIGSAVYASGLAGGCRVARELGDAARYQRYTETVERCLQFVTTLQYTDANTQHFADWYRPRLVGAFHASHQDGNVRIDYTQHAVTALVDYLEFVAP